MTHNKMSVLQINKNWNEINRVRVIWLKETISLNMCYVRNIHLSSHGAEMGLH